MKLFPAVALLFALGSLPAVEKFMLDNGHVRLAVEDGTLVEVTPAGASNLIREIKLLEFLHPTAIEEKSVVISTRKKATAGGEEITIHREGSAYSCVQTLRLEKNSDTADVRLRLTMKQPLRIGILRMPVVSGAPSADAVLHSEEWELNVADTAGLLANLDKSYDFFHGIFDRSSGRGLLVIVENNRKTGAGIFRNYRKMPGRCRFGYELNKGPFGEIQEVKPGDTLDFRFKLLFVGMDPEKSLNALYPGASVKPKRKTGLDGAIQVFWDPTLYRDDRKMFLLGNFPNPMAVLFYQRKDGAPPMKELRFRLDLPEGIELQKAVVFNYWIPRSVQTSFQTEPISLEGRPGRRYLLQAPNPITFVCDKNLFDSIKHHQLYLYLKTPEVSSATPFIYRWQLQKPGTEPGELFTGHGEILPWTPNRDVPKRIGLWYSHTPLRHLVWADAAQREAYLAMFKAQGITVLSGPETAPYMKPEMPELKKHLRGLGFRLHAPYDFLRKEAMENLKNPVPGSVWTLLNGKVSYEGNNPQHSFCPSYLLRTDTALHRRLKEAFARFKEIDCMWHDWEGKTFHGCYCADCRKNFAAFARLDPEALSGLTPLQLARKYTKEWIYFRHYQSALMFKMFKEMARAGNPKIVSGMDFEYIETDFVFPGLGRGRTLFCEDPRLMKEAEFDFVLPDALFSGLKAYEQVAVSVKELKIPVIPKTGSVGGLAFYAGSWVSRRLLADFQRRPLGLDDWPRLARISALAHASSGAKGILLEGAPVDALTQLEYMRLAHELARTEAYYLDGKDISGECSFHDYFIPEKQRPRDDSLAAPWVYFGNPPETFWRCRVHRLHDGLLVSYFNFDLAQKRTLRIELPPSLCRDATVVYEPVSMACQRSPSGKLLWSGDELKRGIVVSAQPVGNALRIVAPSRENLRFGNFLPEEKVEGPGRKWEARPLGKGRIEDQLETTIFQFSSDGL